MNTKASVSEQAVGLDVVRRASERAGQRFEAHDMYRNVRTGDRKPLWAFAKIVTRGRDDLDEAAAMLVRGITNSHLELFSRANPNARIDWFQPSQGLANDDSGGDPQELNQEGDRRL